MVEGEKRYSEDEAWEEANEMKNAKWYGTASAYEQAEKRAEFVVDAKKRIRKVLGDPTEYEKSLNADAKGSGYMYFDPEWCFEKGLVDEKMVSALERGASLLSVGTGRADLERVLWKGYKIPKDKISIADIKLHTRAKRAPFSKFQFDMKGEWPDSLGKFDFIVFPESFGVAIDAGPGSMDAGVIYQDLKKDEEEGKIDAHMTELMRELEKGLSDAIKQELVVIQQALLHLSEGGEIRMVGDLMGDYEEKELQKILKETYPRIIFKRAEGRKVVGRRIETLLTIKIDKQQEEK